MTQTGLEALGREIQKPLSQEHVAHQLLDLGVVPGGTLLVHCAFARVKPIENGPLGLILTLQAALGPEGTLVMPSMTDDDDHPFDPEHTPCAGMGVVANTFWQLPGVLRSDSPHAFAAKGPQASQITAPHPVAVPHGLNSPAGRVYELDGQVLLLGVGHDANTTIHLAESFAGVRYRRKKYALLLTEGKVTRFDYAETDHCCQNFELVDGWLDAEKVQLRGRVGYSVDELWFSELRGVEPSEPYPAADIDDRAIIRVHWDSVEQRMRDYLAALRDDMLFDKPIEEPEEDKDLSVWQVLLHVVNHGTDHRAQLLRLLNDWGIETTSQDYIFYVYDHL